MLWHGEQRGERGPVRDEDKVSDEERSHECPLPERLLGELVQPLAEVDRHGDPQDGAAKLDRLKGGGAAQVAPFLCGVNHIHIYRQL